MAGGAGGDGTVGLDLVTLVGDVGRAGAVARLAVGLGGHMFGGDRPFQDLGHVAPGADAGLFELGGLGRDSERED